MRSTAATERLSLPVAAVFVAFCCFASWLDAAVARVQQAPASRIAIELPDGYEAAQLFSGFINEALGISLVVVEMPARAYESLVSGLTPDALAAKGVHGIRKAKLPRAEPHVFISGEQSTQAGRFAKFMVVFREADVTALITANVPSTALDSGHTTASEIMSVLSTARVVATPAAPRELFKLGYLGPFRPAGSILGSAKAFTLTGSSVGVPPDPRQPLLIIAPSIDRRPVPKPVDYARQLLAGLAGPAALEIGSIADISFDGLAGVEIVATLRDTDRQSDLLLYQVILMPPAGGYFRILGQVPLADRDRYLGELRKIARSFSPSP